MLNIICFVDDKGDVKGTLFYGVHAREACYFQEEKLDCSCGRKISCSTLSLSAYLMACKLECIDLVWIFILGY